MPTPDLLPVTLAEQLRCVEREIEMRRRAYPRWVDAGRMTAQKTDQELSVMKAVEATLRGLITRAN